MGKDLAREISPPASPLAVASTIILPHYLHHATTGTKGHAYEEITDDPIDEEEFWTNMGKVRECVLVRVMECLVHVSLCWAGRFIYNTKRLPYARRFLVDRGFAGAVLCNCASVLGSFDHGDLH